MTLQKQKQTMKKDHQHIPVLLNEVLSILAPKSGETLLDTTAGYGGHSSAILERTLQTKGSVLVDRDQQAIQSLRQRFKGTELSITRRDFLAASQALEQKGSQFDIILADLGLSSPHVDDSQRGFSFQKEGPLDMRMDQRQAVSAQSLVNELGLDELTNLIKDYGEERQAKRIAQAIVDARPLTTTSQLAEVVETVVPRRGKVHPATKTFQAIRLAVNNELVLLEKALPIWLRLLKPGGRLAIISFHSLEDRIVKKFFANHGGKRFDAELTILTKKPVTASPDEKVFNPRARSAKLRAAAKK